MKHTEAMEHYQTGRNDVNVLIGFLSGLIGGASHLINSHLHYNPIITGEIHWGANFEAAAMAVVCGMCGVAGKYLFSLIVKFIKTKKQKK